MNLKNKKILILILITTLACGVLYFFSKNKFQKKGIVLGAGDFTNQIIGITNTQAVLTYSSPTSSPCSVLVSESNTYSPLINDVNPTLFSDSDKDNRQGSSSSGSERVFVIGKRSAELALDGNRYSRALQAYTTHYYKIVCGSLEGTGSFTTKNIPTGNTYSDTIPHNGNGSSSWPTILNDRNQIIIDPQTGLKITRVSLVSDSTSSTGTYPGSLSFGASASTDVCSETLVADNNGQMGYHCLVDIALFWVNPNTGEARPVGVPASLYDNVNFGGFAACNNIDPINANLFYCIRTTLNNKTVLVKLEYKGQNTFFNKELPNCTGSNEPCVESTILTPETGNNDLISLIKNFDPEYPDNFNISGYLPTISAIQNGRIIIQHLRSIQDSYAWYIVFDPGNGIPVGQPSSNAGVIAAMSTYKNYPIRWCSSHGIPPMGNVDWLFAGSNYLRGDSSSAGYGMYTTNIVAGNLPNTTYSCPTNSFNDSLCTDIVVDGEPCDENEDPQTFNAKCGVSSHSYLQDAEVGDLFGIEPNPSRGRLYKEFVRLIVKSGNNWTVSRGINQTPIASHATGVLDAACTAHDTEQANYDLTNWVWDFINDPHGTGTPGTTIVYDKGGTGGHGAYRPDKMIEIYGSYQYQIRSGAVPDYIDATKTIIDDGNPAFASVQGIGYPNTVDSHPSPFYNDEFYLDGRTLNSGITYSSPATNLGSGIYKYASGSTTLNRKKLATLAYSGTNILKDISGPSSNINTASDHSYCVVVNPEECNTGSLAGEVYVKSTTATIATCPFPGVAQTGWEQKHICIGDNGMYTQAIAQVGPNVRSNGKNGRMLTHALTTYNRQDVFWNLRATPDSSGLLFTLPLSSLYGEGSGQLFYAKLPPFSVDATVRDDFMNIPVTIPEYAGATSASVKFGYAENGNPENFYCTSRNEACVKASESGKNYSFNSEGFSPVSCASGCTINIPAIPTRVVYLKVQYHDSNGDLISTLNTQVVAAEPEFNISSASGPSFSISSIASSNIGNNSATITWTTSTSTDSQVLYGLTNSYASSTIISDTSPRVTSHSVNLTGLTKNTTYLFVVKSVDALGNSITSSEQTFTTANLSGGLEEDTTPPTVSITSPTNSAVISGSSVSITASASDNIGISGVQFKFDSTTNIGAEDTSGPYSVNWDTTSVSNGSHTILAVARDAAGNYTTSTPITITINNSSSGNGTTTVISSNGGGGGYSGNVYTPIQIPNYENTNKPSLKIENIYSAEKNECIVNNNGTYNLLFEGERYGFSSPAMLAAHGYDFKDAIQSDQQDKELPYSSNLLPPDGAIIKSTKNSTIYIISSGKKRPFANYKVFTNWGYKQNSIINFSEQEINSVPTGEPISSSESRHLRGTNIKDGNTVYWLGEKVRYPYKNPDPKTSWQSIFNTWNTDKDLEKVIPANEFDKKIPIADPVIPRKICK